MSHTRDRRQDLRVLANFECYCASTWRTGSGVIADISYSGALLEEASIIPARGDLIGLTIDLRPAGSFLLIGWVVRHTQDGFAIEYDEPDAETRRLVDDTAAIVRAPARPRPATSD